VYRYRISTITLLHTIDKKRELRAGAGELSPRVVRGVPRALLFNAVVAFTANDIAVLADALVRIAENWLVGCAVCRPSKYVRAAAVVAVCLAP
jgi:hypothetical protein